METITWAHHRNGICGWPFICGLEGSTLKVQFVSGDESSMVAEIKAAARWLKDAVARWESTGEVPSGHNVEHPEAVHLSRLEAMAG